MRYRVGMTDLAAMMTDYRKLNHLVSVFKGETVTVLTPEGVIFSRNGSTTGYRFSRPSASGVSGEWLVETVQVPA
jgi:hypothetical protein